MAVARTGGCVLILAKKACTLRYVSVCYNIDLYLRVFSCAALNHRDIYCPHAHQSLRPRRRCLSIIQHVRYSLFVKYVLLPFFCVSPHPHLAVAYRYMAHPTVHAFPIRPPRPAFSPAALSLSPACYYMHMILMSSLFSSAAGAHPLHSTHQQPQESLGGALLPGVLPGGPFCHQR